ncbi:MAG: hypothetical protein JOZ47_02275 [Kutzneria sp.]|nr:hypothetical protein [Kutzneria sp.]
MLAVLAAGTGIVTAPTAAAATGSAAAATAVLITGDQVVTAPGGNATVVPAVQKGIGRELVHLGLAGRSYELPVVALPYLGRGLDLSLFDVGALSRAEQGGRLPVTIDWHGQHTAVPGVAMTGPDTGYLTADSAKKFGAALVSRYLSDRSHGGTPSYGPQDAAIRLAGTPTSPPRRPAYPMHTLTVNANDPTGRSDDGDTVFAYNIDDGTRFGDPNESAAQLSGGAAKFSVPEGNYSVLALFASTDAEGDVTGVRIVSQPQIAVTADTATRLDADRATSQVTWVTPRPALLDDGGFFFRRADVAGRGFSLDIANGPGVPVWVAPTNEPVSIGELQTYPYDRLISPPAPGKPYEYQLQKATTGVIPEQRYVVSAADLVTVNANYYSEVNSVGYRQRAGMYAFEREGNVRSGHPLDLPRTQTEYLLGDPDVLWYGGTAKYYEEMPGFTAWYGAQYDTARTYRAGETVGEGWNKFPLHPAGAASLLNPSSTRWITVPPVVRAGDEVSITLVPFSDNQPGHTGMGYYGEKRDTFTGAYEIDQNGATVAAGDPTASGHGAREFTTKVTLTPDRATARLVLDATRTGPMYTQSTRSHTEWTWTSTHQQGSTLPDAFVCAPRRPGVPPDRSCAVEPLLTLGYDVQGMSFAGGVGNGAQGVDVTVGHLQQSTASPITGASLRYSTDDGKTWLDATTTSTGDGTFHAAFDASAPDYHGAYLSLRTTATDSAGSRIDETLVDAYRLGGEQ